MAEKKSAPSKRVARKQATTADLSAKVIMDMNLRAAKETDEARRIANRRFMKPEKKN